MRTIWKKIRYRLEWLGLKSATKFVPLLSRKACYRLALLLGWLGASLDRRGRRVAIVTSGLRWAQREGGAIEEIRPGDVVWFPPNEKHWHGAMPTSAMTHIAIQEALDGKVVDWMEQVSEAQYGGKE
jgi:hypothetical protein